MDPELVTKAAEATLTGTLPFPEIISILLKAGVEYYHVDYAGRCKNFYGTNGEKITTSIDYEILPPIAPELNIKELREAIKDSQLNGQKYYDFTVRAMSCGVQAYYAFLRGKRVTYMGRTGDQHIEWFPGVDLKKD